MGRALFSQRYRSEPAVCEDPVAVSCQRWSPCNQFDPDSEDFFKNAQLEQFLDGLFDSSVWTLEHSSPRDNPHAAVLGNASDTASSPTTASSNDDESLSDSNDSPMAIGTDDPASLLDDYVPADFAQDGPRRQSHSTRPSSRRPSEDSLSLHQTSPAPDSIVSAPYRASSTSTPVSTAQMHPEPQQEAGTPRSPVVRRTVNITPINIPTQPSPPTPASPSPPAPSAPFRLRDVLPSRYMWDHRLYLH